MYGKWSQWKPIPNIPNKMYMEKLIDGYDGLEIILKVRDDRSGVKITFPYLVLSYQSTDEGTRYKTLIFLDNEYGTDFYAKWTLFEVQDSALIKWVQEESCIGDDLQAKQFTLLTSDEFIDIITLGDPDIEVL
jgi:putative uncharacterized protein (fragment)